MAISVCREWLSTRHHPRSRSMQILETGRCAALQFLPPGAELDRAMEIIASVPEDHTEIRIAATELEAHQAATNPARVFRNAYMICEARLVQPGRDFDWRPIYEKPYADVGSHRAYFLEITAIQLRRDLAQGISQIHWRALPEWLPETPLAAPPAVDERIFAGRYKKPYTPNYNFPSPGTIAFQPDEIAQGMAIKYLPPLATDQVEIDNDRARWPCYFPSSLGLISTWDSVCAPNRG